MKEPSFIWLLVGGAVLFAIVFATFFVGRSFWRLIARVRYSLGELLLLFLLTGLIAGCTARALPAGLAPLTATLIALGVGLAPLLGGAWGIYAAHWLGIENSWRRMLMLLAGVVLGPVIIFGVAAIVILAFYLILLLSDMTRFDARRLALLVGLSLASVALYRFLYRPMTRRIARRIRESEQAEQAAEAAETSPAEKPPESEQREAAAQEGSHTDQGNEPPGDEDREA